MKNIINTHTHHILLLGIIIAALAVVGKAQTMSSPLTYGVYECPNYNGVTPACDDTRVAGCVEYKNGAREYRTDGNECVFCSLPSQSVASFTRGSDCSDLQSPTPTPTPTPRPRPTPNPTPFPRFNNRNWFTNNNNNNNNNGNRFWFTNNNNNNGNNNNNNNNFTPEKCPDYTFVTPACADTQEAGCVGYKNGAYEYRTDGNACFFCSLPGRPVASFTPGQRCPTRQTRRTPTFTSGGGRTVVVRRGGGVSTGGVFRGGVFRGTKH